MFVFLKKSVEFDVFERLVIFRLPLLIAHIIASIFLIVVITYFVYKPLTKWLKKRKMYFQDKENLITKNLNTAENFRKQTTKELAQNRKMINKMLLESKKQTDIERKNILKIAQINQKKIIENANLLADQKKKALKKEIETAIISNSVLLVKKILNSEINDKKHEKLINEFIDNLDKKDDDYDQK